MAAAAMMVVIVEPLMADDAFNTHGITPHWVMILIFGLRTYRVLLARLQILVHQQYGALTHFLDELANHLTAFTGCVGDPDHCRWLHAFEVTPSMQVHAATEFDILEGMAYQAMSDLGGWIQNENDAVLDNHSRMMNALCTAFDLGTDFKPRTVLTDIYKEIEQSTSFIEVLRRERRQARQAQQAQQDADDEDEDVDHEDGQPAQD